MLDPQLTGRQLVEQFLNVLRELPDVHVRSKALEGAGPTSDEGRDGEIDVEIAGKALTLFIEAKKSVYPRDVRQVLWQIRQFGSERRLAERDDAASVLVAESISPGAKELLRKERIGYFDSGGSLFLPARGAYLYIDKPPPKILARAVRSLFSGRRAQVLHTLLTRHQNWYGVKELAGQASVSPASASQVLSELERFEWLTSRGQGPNKERRLVEPGSLLDAWTEQLASLRPPTLHRYFVSSTGTEYLIDRIGHVCDAHGVEYAITHEAAAQRYTPFLSSVSQVRCRMLAGRAAEAAIGELGARVVSEGANLVILEAKSHGDFLFRERAGDTWLASPIQVYLDLLRGEGRSKEMAGHLRRERIGF
ncbi:MAG: hypothetical protein A3G24_17425 [Betaproteobacteria bacterium RIFCSPLOWO2_12_FULL_62_13]|nr:MAG: hypothetical protein A3G24_17425 [Betaproteobacteria bacterium RIFCSPLOWO2_12_FULL_62_13]